MTSGLAPIFLRLRHVLLALVCLVLLSGFIRHSPSWFLGGAVLLAAGVALAQFRYLRLAMVAALAPLPGVAWFAPTYFPFAFGLGVLMAAGLVIHLLKGRAEEESFAALFDPVPGAVGAVLLALAWSLWSHAHVEALAGAIVSVLLALPVGVIFLPFGEHFHVAANRAREMRDPAGRVMAQLAQPRWAFSLCGIALVFAVLAIFLRAAWPQPLDWIACVLVAPIFYAATLDWRTAGAGLLCAALLLLAGQGMTVSLLLFVLLAMFVAGRPDRDGEVTAAWSLKLEDRAVPVFFAGLGASLTAAMLDGAGQGLLALAATAVSLFAFPALTLAQHQLLPRRRSVEDLYRNW